MEHDVSEVEDLDWTPHDGKPETRVVCSCGKSAFQSHVHVVMRGAMPPFLVSRRACPVCGSRTMKPPPVGVMFESEGRGRRA